MRFGLRISFIHCLAMLLAFGAFFVGKVRLVRNGLTHRYVPLQ